MDWFGFFETMLDNIHEAIYILDKNRRFVFMNRAFFEIVSSTRGELMQHDVYELRDKGFFNLCLSDMVFEQQREVTIYQESVGGHNGRQLHINTCTPIFNENGEIEYYVAIALPLAVLNEKYRRANENADSRQLVIKPSGKRYSGEVIAQSPQFKAILDSAYRIADSDAPVLILGETGTGKEVVARYIHQCSKRANMPFVDLNCASLPENLMEAELFGYQPGAFTGASAKGKAGLLEAAHGGTLFLDEINSMPLTLQGKLLRAIETKTIMRLGATKATKVDFRVLAASNQNLQECVETGQFRKDLLYRLNTFALNIPPLRGRREDIEPLVGYYLSHYGAKYGRAKWFSPKVMNILKEYPWPGNVRELKNFVERIMVMSASDVIEIKELPPNVLGETMECAPAAKAEGRLPADAGARDEGYRYNGSLSLKENLSAFERSIIRQAVKQNGSLSKAAKVLKSSKATLSRKLNRQEDG